MKVQRRGTTSILMFNSTQMPQKSAETPKQIPQANNPPGLKSDFGVVKVFA